MLYVTCLGLFLPLLGFLSLMVISSFISRRQAVIVACTTIGIACICFTALFCKYLQTDMQPVSFTLFNWIPIKGIDATFNLHLDALSLLMTLIITGVSFLIHVYSIGYMDHEEDFARYFACLNVFVFAMLLLVLSGNLLLLFVGWEGVGVASYLLIGFWYQRPEAAGAATKAFIVNRIGDLGLLVGLFLTFHLFGTSDIATISARASQEFAVGAPIITILTLLYFIGACGKSAQLPLHVWLPDAMAGPTPVSALIHAATMVTAGVYLVVRMHSSFELAPMTLLVVGTAGGLTSLVAALSATAQTDLKRVLAYSTVSQLGLMFLACSVGAFYAAMFHLTTHAFVKALLFLAAGNVVHMMHGTTDMGKMGGLSRIFTFTHWLFLIGAVALAGIPPLAVFFSKELILEQAYLTGFKTFFYTGLIASILTAFYLIRAYCLTFTGKSHLEPHMTQDIREAPLIMLVPVVMLAFLATIGGFFGFSFSGTPPLERLLATTGVTLAAHESGSMFSMPSTWMAIIGAFGGVGTAALLYTRFVDRMGNTVAWLRESFYVDKIYHRVIVVPLHVLAGLVAFFLEPHIFDGLVRVIANNTQRAAHGLQLVQSGQIRSYVAYMVYGAVLLIVYLVLGQA